MSSFFARVAVLLTAFLLVISAPIIWLLASVSSVRLLAAGGQASLGITLLVWALFNRASMTQAAPLHHGTGVASTGSAAGDCIEHQ